MTRHGNRLWRVIFQQGYTFIYAPIRKADLTSTYPTGPSICSASGGSESRSRSARLLFPGWPEGACRRELRAGGDGLRETAKAGTVGSRSSRVSWAGLLSGKKVQ